MKQNHNPTMKDVAEQAQVSVSTVSYVLNNRGQVSEARRRRVLNAIRALDYIPNESARNLKRQQASTIGLVVPDLVNQFFSLLARGVVKAAAMHDVLVVLCSAENTEEAEFGNERLLRSKRVNGVIYESGFQESPLSLLKLQSIGPVVLVDERFPGLDLPTVVADGRRGAREIASHLVELGHKRFACVAGPGSHWTSEQRLAGYREGLAMGGINPDEMGIREGDYQMDSGYQLAESFLNSPKNQRPSALLCANDLMAIGALEYCRSNSIHVPGEVSIVGFDDIPTAQLLTPRLTTVRQPAYEMGMSAAKLLIAMTQCQQKPELLRPHPVELVLRESSAAPNCSRM